MLGGTQDSRGGKNTERFDLLDSMRRPLGKTMVRGTPQPEGTWRQVVHVCVFSHDGRLLIQKRQPFKSGW